MTCLYMWHLCIVFSVLAVPGEQRGQQLAVPQILRVYSEEDQKDLGVFQMNIEWKDEFTNTRQPQKATYELKIFHMEYRRPVHNETVEVTPDLTGVYHWSWTSPIPLQCTSHSVQLRLREDNKTSEWSNEYILEGNTKDEDKVYPQNLKVLVNESMVFCCILQSHKVERFRSSDFTIQISNRTFITKPVRYPDQTPPTGKDIVCGDSGATYYTGYPPDVHNLTCETRDLSSVECRWSRGLKDGFVGGIGNERYSINGRSCSSEKCVLEQSVDGTVTNWTLTAENILGKKTISDVADPKHRVRLKVPEEANTSAVGERTAELKWKWTIINYTTFPMTCQVQLNGLMVNETFNGTGLHSASLKDLQTSTDYKAQVRCGAREHFYTWGDWSDPISFRTKPDSSKTADMWMKVLRGQTNVVWKPIGSDYQITELHLGNSPKAVTKLQNKSCYEVEPASTGTHRVISVSAKNLEWTSPPSSITLPNPSEGGVKTSAINASNGGFYLTWEPSPVSSCGYVVDWYPTYSEDPCAIDWIRVSSRVYSTHIHSDFKEGVSYTLSVYACTSGAPKLLQRREGYVKELAPSGTVQNLKVKQLDSDVYLSWGDVPKVYQRGIIQGYNVSYGSPNGSVIKWVVIRDPRIQEHKFRLHPDTYRFTVKPLTSAGEGPGDSYTLAINPPIEKIIVIVICILAAATCTLAILYRKRNWLKSVFYPDIPKPGLSEEWYSKGLHQCQLIDKLLTAEREVLKICYPDSSSQRKADLHKEDEETQLLYSPGSQDSPLPGTWEMIPEHQILNPIMYSTPVIPVTPVPYSNPVNPVTSVTPVPYSNPVTPVTLITYTNPITPIPFANPVNPVTPITVDFSYMELPCTAVQNPTYNIAVERLPGPPLATDIVVTPGYIPQKQNVTEQRPSSVSRW